MLQCVRRCYDHGRFPKTNSKYQNIGLAFVCAVFAFLTPMSDAFAVSKEEQRRCLEYAINYADKLNVQLDQRARQSIRRYCLKGDVRTAKRIVASRAEASADKTSGAPADDAKSCFAEVREYAAKLNVRLDRSTAKRVEAYCRRGDTRSAKRVVGSYAKASADKSGKQPADDAKSCFAEVREYAARLNVKLDRSTAKEVSGYCRRGDVRSAKRVVASRAKASADKSGRPPADDAKSCFAKVREYAARLNVKLDRSTAKEASGYCRRGDTRSALRVVRSQAKGSRKS